jgi:hypothetical protein
MMKFPLSDTTGPAFIFPILNLKPGSPSSILYGDPRSAKLSRTLAYANGVTSMGIPFFHYLLAYYGDLMKDLRLCRGRENSFGSLRR